MLKEIKKGLMAGLGAVFLTREKVEEITRRLVEEAKLSPEDAQKLSDELLERGEHQWTQLEDALSEMLQKGQSNLDLASRKELEQLKETVDNLEKRLSILERLTAQEGV